MKDIRYINAGAGSGKTFSLTDISSGPVKAGSGISRSDTPQYLKRASPMIWAAPTEQGESPSKTILYEEIGAFPRKTDDGSGDTGVAPSVPDAGTSVPSYPVAGTGPPPPFSHPNSETAQMSARKSETARPAVVFIAFFIFMIVMSKNIGNLDQ